MKGEVGRVRKNENRQKVGIKIDKKKRRGKGKEVGDDSHGGDVNV